MNPRCISDVEQAIGRALTRGETRALDEAVQGGLKELSRAKPQEYAAMTGPQRLQAAADMLQQKHQAAAQLKLERAHLAILAQSSRGIELAAGIQRGATGARALGDVFVRADTYVKGVPKEYFSRLIDTIHSIEPRFLGLIEDTRALKPFVDEVLSNASGRSGMPIVQKAARAWLDTIEAMRVRLNRAGGDVGKLDYGYLPTTDNPARIRKVTPEAYAEVTLGRVDRSRYVDLAGRELDDAAMLELLREVYNTKTTDAVDKITPGAFHGSGARANRGSEHRVLHFKDADSVIANNADFGGGSVFSAMQAHVTRLGRDIGLVEHFGPNPNHTVAILDDLALQTDRGQKHFARAGATTKGMWAVLSGASAMIEHQQFASIAQGVRNIQVFGKLQGALIASISDVPSYFVTTGFNRIPVGEAVVHLIRGFGRDSRSYAERAGLIVDGLIADMHTMNDANLRENWTGKLSDLTMKVSLLQGWTSAIRRGFSTAMMGGLAKISRTEWGRLDAADRTRLETKGVTAQDFGVWKLAELEDWRGVAMLTPENIRAIPDEALAALPGGAMRARDQAISRLLGVIADESEYASLAPNLHSRTIATFGGQAAGTMEGELARSVMLFKGFPLAMMTRHLARIMHDPMSRGSRVAYTAKLIVGTTMFGAISLQIADLLAGKDPRNMNPTEGEHGAKFWLAAMMKGGGLGFIGDIIYQASGGGQSQSGVSTAANVGSSILGPVFGSVLELGDATLGNIPAALKGKDTKIGAELVRWARSHTPFVNLWYARSTIDHAVLNDLQELASPGYLARMERRVQRDWGQSYYWAPNQSTPDRGPDFERAWQ